MTIISVGTVDEVLEHALVTKLQPIEWDEAAEEAAALAAQADGDNRNGVITH
jgi:ATP-dependent Lon protease